MDMNEWLYVNDETFGEICVGTREQFREALRENFDVWYAEVTDRGETYGVSRDEWVENQLYAHPTVEGVKNFWRWFGESKVVDSEGRPLVVYHGTDAEFDAFDTSDRSMNLSARNPLGENIGSFFASKERDAKRFGPRVGKYYVGLKNPRVFKTQNDFRAFMRENSGMTPDVRDAEGFIISEGRFENNTRKAIESAGHDGVVILNPQYSTKKDKPWVVAFDPTQIKSAIGNRGTFDPAAPSILTQSDRPFDGSEAAATPLPEGATTIEVDGVERPALNSEGLQIHPTGADDEDIKHYPRL